MALRGPLDDQFCKMYKCCNISVRYPERHFLAGINRESRHDIVRTDRDAILSRDLGKLNRVRGSNENLFREIHRVSCSGQIGGLEPGSRYIGHLGCADPIKYVRDGGCERNSCRNGYGRHGVLSFGGLRECDRTFYLHFCADVARRLVEPVEHLKPAVSAMRFDFLVTLLAVLSVFHSDALMGGLGRRFQ